MGKEGKGKSEEEIASRELYAAIRELQAVRKLLSENAGLDILEEMEAKRQIDVHQRLIDFFLTKASAPRDVTLERFKTQGFRESLHFFSRNRFSLVLPDPLTPNGTFTVSARLSDLRRPGVVASSMEARTLIDPKAYAAEPKEVFIARTFEELVASEKYRQTKLASNLNKDRAQLPYLKDLQETLLLGRLMALSQIEPTPDLVVNAHKGKRLYIQATYGDLTFSQDFNSDMPRSPEEHRTILANNGTVFTAS